MLNRTIFIAVGLLAQSFSLVVNAQETYSCPETIKVSSAQLSADSVPTGFNTTISNSPIHLTGINAYDGPPEQGAALVPTSSKNLAPNKGSAQKLEKVTTAIWNFEGDFAQGKFISCDYAQGLIRVTAKVPDSAKACTAITGYEMPMNVLQASFSCK